MLPKANSANIGAASPLLPCLSGRLRLELGSRPRSQSNFLLLHHYPRRRRRRRRSWLIMVVAYLEQLQWQKRERTARLSARNQIEKIDSRS